MHLYVIKNWSKIFENNRSRDLKNLHWVSIPNKHDGAKYAELVSHENGAEHFAAWVLIVQVASRCGITAGSRGQLVRGDGTPHTTRSLSLITRCKEKIFIEAIPRLLELQWLELIEIQTIPQGGAGKSQGGAGKLTHLTIEGKGREGKGIEKDKTSQLFESEKIQSSHTNLSVTDIPEEPYFPKVTNEFEPHEPNGKNPAEFDQFDQFSENSPETPPSHHVEPDPILPLPQVLNEHLDAFPAVSGGSEFDSQVQLPPEVKNREEAGQKTEAVPIAPIQEQKKIKADKLWPTDSYEYETAHAFATEYLPGWAPSAKPASDAIIQKWATEVDLMQRIDGRSWEDVNNLLNLIEKEKPSRTGFEWKKVILSMGTLRQRWNEGKLEDLINNNKKKTGGW